MESTRGEDVMTERTQSEEVEEEDVKSVLMSVEERWRAQFPMDTLYSWLVLGAGFVTYMTQMGFITSFGLYAEMLSEEFGASVGQASFAGGLTVGVMSCTAVLGAIVYRMLGSRLCILIGSTWSVLGFLAASQAHTLAQLYAANFTIGLGFAFNLISISSAQVDYFIKYRIFALSFQSVGAAVGTTLMPEALLRVIDNFGWRSSFLVLSGACGIFYLVAAIMASRRPRLFAVPFSQIFQLSLLKRKTFIVICCNCFLWGGSSYSFFFLIARYISHIKMERSTGALVVSVLGGCNIVGRIASSFLSHQDCTNRLVLNAVSCAIWSVATICFQLPKSEAGLVVVGAVFGLGFGIMYPSLTPLLLELFGADAIAASQGMAWFCLGLGCLSFPWLTGWVVEEVNYGAAYSFLGAAGLIAAAATAGIAVARGLNYPVAVFPPSSSVSVESLTSRRERESLISACSIRDSLRATNAPLSVDP